MVHFIVSKKNLSLPPPLKVCLNFMCYPLLLKSNKKSTYCIYLKLEITVIKIKNYFYIYMIFRHH